jgi:hypothetical protein
MSTEELKEERREASAIVGSLEWFFFVPLWIFFVLVFFSL